MSSSSSLSQIPRSYATASAGMHPTHTLPLKLQAIADAGFKYTEIAFPDLEALASFTFNGEYKQLDEKGEGDVSKLVDTAIEVNKICGSLGLKVLSVMPFPQFEGYTDPRKKENSLNRAWTMFKVLHGLGCDMLQVGSTNDPSTSGDYDVIVEGLRELADEAAKQNPPIKIAYEMWAWGVHANSWEHTWDICKRVDRSNFGLCLDTFQISAIYYASKLSNNLSTPYPLPPLPAPSLADSLTSLADTLKPHIDKIFYLQISDAAFPPASSAFSMPPSTGMHELNAVERAAKEKDVHVLYAWSDSWRPLPFHKQVRPDAEGIREGILPVLDICRAVLRTGWRGPWSYEVFYADSQSKEDPDIPRRWTEDAMKAHELILEALQNEGF